MNELGDTGTSDKKVRRTAKKLMPSEHCAASATKTLKTSPRRFDEWLNSASSSMVATLNGGSALAAKKRISSSITMWPDMRPVMMMAFSGDAQTAWAMANSLGQQSSGKVSTLIFVPCLPSWNEAWYVQRLQYALSRLPGKPRRRLMSYILSVSPCISTFRTNCLRRCIVSTPSGMPRGSDSGKSGCGRIGNDDKNPSSPSGAPMPLTMSSNCRPSVGSFKMGVPVKPASTRFFAVKRRFRKRWSCSEYCVCVRTKLWASSMSTTLLL
mmetsp:Transcript_99032/g.302780  ORF Transcript_99032/g.302780 Transcript_99032/m.302780 type:complete len:268 (+) Transcript_99032:559-1362(+)